MRERWSNSLTWGRHVWVGRKKNHNITLSYPSRIPDLMYRIDTWGVLWCGSSSDFNGLLHLSFMLVLLGNSRVGLFHKSGCWKLLVPFRGSFYYAALKCVTLNSLVTPKYSRDHFHTLCWGLTQPLDQRGTTGQPPHHKRNPRDTQVSFFSHFFLLFTNRLI